MNRESLTLVTDELVEGQGFTIITHHFREESMEYASRQQRKPKDHNMQPVALGNVGILTD